MVALTEVRQALSAMILSHSGWRGVFAASGGEEGRTGDISGAHAIIAAGAGVAFAEYLRGLAGEGSRPLALVGCDTRPTGRAIAGAIIPALEASGCQARYAGVVAAPEIMAWARSLGCQAQPGSLGFVYISASHNPVGHNGLKFGLADGGVLSAKEAGRLTEDFRSLMLGGGEWGMGNGEWGMGDGGEAANKQEAWDAYFRFSEEVAWGGIVGPDIVGTLKRGIAQRPLGVCCDFNGSARCVSIDRDFFTGLGIQFAAINAEPGEIAHRIVPEGESLDPCCAFLEELHRRNPAFVFGYVPDCDGDRGNLVIWDEALLKARALEAQEVFSLACVAELAQLVWAGQIAIDGGRARPKVAVVVNDPSSLRIERIAAAFGASVFRAEVGEANVVGLARKLREDGYTVRILGEASNGGSITHPSAVRDPLHTVLALAKLLSLRSEGGKPGLFELWCTASGQQYDPGYSLADVIASLPPFVTTSAVAHEAVLKIACADHADLKNRYQGIFLREWESRRDELKTRYGIQGWEAAAYNGIEERRGIARFGEAGKGGLKICFQNAGGRDIASIWMRGSATEPIFRIVADAEGSDRQIERDLIDWQRRMTTEADSRAGKQE
ncbi:MAG: phosphatidylglycerol lysyltransferase [Treponema sp.]|jgi:phosphoglucomutase|nr:phosphatidylglycerol lysyltransferase [Treponema sp.]